MTEPDAERHHFQAESPTSEMCAICHQNIRSGLHYRAGERQSDAELVAAISLFIDECHEANAKDRNFDMVAAMATFVRSRIEQATAALQSTIR